MSNLVINVCGSVEESKSMNGTTCLETSTPSHGTKYNNNTKPRAEPSRLHILTPSGSAHTLQPSDSGVSIVEKTRILPTVCSRSVGRPWFITKIWDRAMVLNSRFIERIRMVPYLYVVLGVRALAVLLLLVMGVLMFAISSPAVSMYVALVIYILNQLALACVTVRAFYETRDQGFEKVTTFMPFLCMILIDAVLCPIITYLAESSIALIVTLMLLSFFLINLIYELNILAWIFAMPVLGLIALGEAAVRICKCELDCPREERIVLACTYKLYPYTEGEFEEKVCAICQDQFHDKDMLCRLKCGPTHVFHEECIFAALPGHPFCPVCRQPPVFL